MGRKKLETEITIDSSVEKIWQVLIDFEKYSTWNSRLHCLSAETVQEQKFLKLEIIPEKKKKTTALVEVLESVPSSKLTWRGRLFGFRGVLTGDHSFELVALGPNQTRVLHYEYFSGILVPFVWSFYLNTTLREVFEKFNQALKAKVE